MSDKDEQYSGADLKPQATQPKGDYLSEEDRAVLDWLKQHKDRLEFVAQQLDEDAQRVFAANPQIRSVLG
ncbi:MAG: hypothetical protein Alpg2KO_25020 [Alphaproteobacteria bacterium]